MSEEKKKRIILLIVIWTIIFSCLGILLFRVVLIDNAWCFDNYSGLDVLECAIRENRIWGPYIQ